MNRSGLIRLLLPCMAVALPLLVLPAGAQASRDSVSLPLVVVTADRVPVAVARSTSAVSVLPGEALRAAGITHVLDALRQVPGVSVARAGSGGAQTSLFVRGGESDFVRVLVDGVPMNDPGGAMDLATLTTDNIDRIEVVRGPASVLYGSDAVVGVVQIFTRQAQARREARLAVRGGSYATSDAEGSVGLAGPGRSLSLGIARHASDGVLPFNNDYRNTVGSLRATAVLPWAASVVANVRRGDNTFHYPTDGAGAVVDRNARRAERRTSASLDLVRGFGDRVESMLTLGALEAHGRTDDAQDDAADTVGFHAYRARGVVRRQHADLRINLRPSDGHVLTLGAEYAGEGQRVADSSNYDARTHRFSASRITRAAFGQAIGGAGRLTYSFGARHDDNDVFGSFRTARAGLALALWEGARLRSAYGTAFKAPTFLETFSTAFSVGNADLRPERSRSWEAGIEQRVGDGWMEAGVTFFDQRFRDLIQYTWTSPADPNYFNIAAAASRGIEVDLRLRALTGVALWANATAMRTRVDDAGFQESSGPAATFVRGQRLLRRPPYTVTAGASVDRLARTHLEFSASRIGPRDDRDFASFPATPLELPPYTRVDLAAEYRLGTESGLWQSAALTVRMENALGARYEEIAGFRAPGRLALVGFRLGTSR